MLKAELGGEFFTVHRLDTNVGGVMVYARTKKAAAELSRAITDGTMIKEYVALVEGTPDESGVLEDLLWKDPKKNKVFVVNRMRGGVKDDIGAIFLEYILHLTLITHATDQNQEVQGSILTKQLLLNLIGVVFIHIKDDQGLWSMLSDLTTKFATNRTATTSYHNDLTF